jgi:hypothetical protein
MTTPLRSPQDSGYAETDEPTSGSRPQIHVKKVEITYTRNEITNIYFPARDPAADIIDAASRFVLNATTAFTTMVNTFFKECQVDPQKIHEGFTKVHNILKAIIPQK